MLSLRNVNVSLGGKHILKALSFDACDDEIIGFIGPNGAGKTTTMQCISGILTPNSGEIFYNGKELSQNRIECQKHIGLLPEGAPLYGDMTPKEFLNFIANMRGFYGDESKQLVRECAIKTNIESVFHQKIETLSKGFKRRVAFASAILHSPKLLILDEPTDGLDPNQKSLALENIKSLKTGRIIIISSHVLDEILQICTRVILINDGQIVIDEPIDEFKGRNNGDVQKSFYNLTSGIAK